MDAVDRKILAELQAEGRLTVTELAERVSLSVAPCHRRLRELERTKAIRGYRAVIDPAAIGLGFEVLVQVTMDREDAATITRFESGLAEIPEVRHAERLFGDPDYLIRVATADLAAYQALRDEKLAALPGVQRLSSTIVMKRIVDDRPYPVRAAARRLARRDELAGSAAASGSGTAWTACTSGTPSKRSPFPAAHALVLHPLAQGGLSGWCGRCPARDDGRHGAFRRRR
jgi:DNA-binding Lrp family transcriptional regulator